MGLVGVKKQSERRVVKLPLAGLSDIVLGPQASPPANVANTTLISTRASPPAHVANTSLISHRQAGTPAVPASRRVVFSNTTTVL